MQAKRTQGTAPESGKLVLGIVKNKIAVQPNMTPVNLATEVFSNRIGAAIAYVIIGTSAVVIANIPAGK